MLARYRCPEHGARVTAFRRDDLADDAAGRLGRAGEGHADRVEHGDRGARPRLRRAARHR